MLRTFVFIDFISLQSELKKLNIYDLDYEALIDYLASPNEGRFLLNSYVFIGIHPDSPHQHQLAVNQFKRLGLEITEIIGEIEGDVCRYDYSVSMATKMMQVSYVMKPDIIVLISNNDSLISVVEHIKSTGIRIEISSLTVTKLARYGSGYIDLKLLTDSSEKGEDEDDSIY